VGHDSEFAGMQWPNPSKPTACAGWHVVRTKKSLHFCVLVTFFLDIYINVLNSCMIGKDKYYVLFNVLKFEEYILYVKVRL